MSIRKGPLGVLIRMDWSIGQVEFGKMFMKNGTETVRMHNSNKEYRADMLRQHGLLTVRTA